MRTSPRLAVAIAAALVAGVARAGDDPAVAEAARNTRDVAALKAFDAAAQRTADGSRAYEYLWSTGSGAGIAGHMLVLLVRTDGSAVLYGAKTGAAPVAAQAVAPFEAAVAASGFPRLPSAARAVCNDGQLWPDVFTASVGGQTAKAFGDACGQVAVPLDKAVRLLRALADANGGVEPGGDASTGVPVAVTAFTPRGPPPRAP